jgi:hypothetical protein
MPQLKQPMRLQDMVIRLYITKYCGKWEKWMEELFNFDFYEFVVRSVFNECREMEDEISMMPPGILKLLSPRLAEKIAKLMCTYGNRIRSLPGKQTSLCNTVFRSVLSRYVEKLDSSSRSRKCVQDFMVQNLDSVPGLLELYLFPTGYHSVRVADMVHHIKNLQIFKYRRDCTDEIIAQLQRHCPHLMELDFSQSIEVTNASVQPLSAARKLKFLNLGGTRIDDEHYAMILSELPNIASIAFRQHEASLLSHIALERLDTITHVRGILLDIDTVAPKFPNITNITMYYLRVDLSGLSAFSALRALDIHDLDYGSSNFRAVLQGVGHRLTKLNLSHSKGVVLHDIITLCPSLANLSLVSCSFLSLNSNTPIDPRLPHFRNLCYLGIRYPYRCQEIPRWFCYYVNLKTIDIECKRFFSVEFVRDILNLGTYKQLEILRVGLNMLKNIDAYTLRLLIAHCPLLKRIELEGIKVFDRDVVEELKRQIVMNNFDLKLKVIKETYRHYFKDCEGCSGEQAFSRHAISGIVCFY